MTATFHVGDAITVMNRLPEKSVDLVLTSPPFLALRSYLPADHPDKHLEGGSQATPGAYIDWLVDVVEACDRILAPHGSMCIELGDTYAGSTSAGPDGWGPATGYDRWEHGRVRTGGAGGTGWPLPKSLSLIPELFRLTLVYGQNPLTGRTTERWRLRNVIRWVRPNPPVGALGDKFRPATSELMVFCKSAKRFFDLDAVREPHQSPDIRHLWPDNKLNGREGDKEGFRNSPMNPGGAPPLDWWNIPPGGYEGAHYAVFPPELCIKPIKAMCPEKVCRVCGEPSRRIVEQTPEYAAFRAKKSVAVSRVTEWAENVGNREQGWDQADDSGARGELYVTKGFSDCSHNNWRPGLVLDPFAGSGTTLAVATGHGRDAIGVDLDERNYDLALERVGPLILQRGDIDALDVGPDPTSSAVEGAA